MRAAVLAIVGWMLLALAAGAAAAAERPASRTQLVERAQWHANAERGMAYLPRAAGNTAEPATIVMRTVASFALDGDATENLRSNMLPVDTDGDGRFELMQFNGYRLIRAFRQDGTRLWELRDGRGRGHRTHVHRDTAVVSDLDGDRRQEIVHCWLDASGRKQLVARSGLTGAVVRTYPLADDGASSECQLAAFRMAGRDGLVILVARQITLPGAACSGRQVDTWSVTLALDPRLSRLWEVSTCNAGHYAWPLDENRDGTAEAVFVGKRLIDATGRVRCTLPGWGDDHVDSMAVADLDPALAGHEVVAVGRTGLRTARAATCTGIAELRPPAVRNPQVAHAAVLTPGTAPLPVVRSRPLEPGASVYRVTPDGRLLGSYVDTDPRQHAPVQTANLDGATGAEDLVARFGRVIDAQGRVRLDSHWYWGLQPLSAQEAALSPYDQWSSAPIVLDLDGDGRDEIVTWGRRMVVIGKAG